LTIQNPAYRADHGRRIATRSRHEFILSIFDHCDIARPRDGAPRARRENVPTTTNKEHEIMSTTTIETIAIDQLATVIGAGSGPGFPEPDPDRKPSTGRLRIDPSAVGNAINGAVGAAFSGGTLMQRLGRAAVAGAAGLATGIRVDWNRN
jgi:hypothetical protein